MKDIIDRLNSEDLRGHEFEGPYVPADTVLCTDAAKEIERLRCNVAAMELMFEKSRLEIESLNRLLSEPRPYGCGGTMNIQKKARLQVHINDYLDEEWDLKDDQLSLLMTNSAEAVFEAWTIALQARENLLKAFGKKVSDEIETP